MNQEKSSFTWCKLRFFPIHLPCSAVARDGFMLLFAASFIDAALLLRRFANRVISERCQYLKAYAQYTGLCQINVGLAYKLSVVLLLTLNRYGGISKIAFY